MSTKKMKFSAAEKFKVALEAIRGEKTLAEISAKYLVHPTQISNWKNKRWNIWRHHLPTN